MYETIVGVVNDIEPNANKGYVASVVEATRDSAWSLAIRKLATLGFNDEQIVNLMQTGQMIAHDVPHSHPSFSKGEDVVRGFIGAMVEGELKLLSSYAVRN